MSDEIKRFIDRGVAAQRAVDEIVGRPQYLIWSFEHNGWWRSNRGGYTQDAALAGIYALPEALDICISANIVAFNEAIVPLNDAIVPLTPLPTGVTGGRR